MNDPNDITAGETGTTWVFNYDRGGNITSKAYHAYSTGTLGTAQETIPYTYGDSNWKDKLTSYDNRSFSYDAIGNPTSDGIWSYEWEVGRRLKSMNADGGALYFKYDHNGLRTQKVVQLDWYPTTYNYLLHGKLITHMTVDYTDWDEVAQKDVLHFFYDAQSRPAKVSFNGVIYTYIHNLQGDIVGLLDSAGNPVVEYKYDVWGKLLSTDGTLADTLGKRNPFRYRGYVYDEESGLYYLRSRYYNPEWGRFINADNRGGSPAALISHNVFAYCSNVPVMMADPNGHLGSLIARIKNTVANAVKNMFLNMVDWIAQRAYSRRDGKMTSINVSKKYITKKEEDSHNDTVGNVVKWTKRILATAIGYATGGALGKAVSKFTAKLSPGVANALSTVGGWGIGDLEDDISDFIIDAYSIKQGSYTSICATFQYEHKHFIFFTCDNDYATYEIRNYGNTYFELWFSTSGCHSKSIGAQKIAVLDIMD